MPLTNTQSPPECSHQNKDQLHGNFLTKQATKVSDNKNLSKKVNAFNESSRNGKKRPDKPLYVPRALRSTSDKTFISKCSLMENEASPSDFTQHSSQNEQLHVKENLSSKTHSCGRTETKLSISNLQKDKENEVKSSHVKSHSFADDNEKDAKSLASHFQEIHICESSTNAEKNSANILLKDDNIINSIRSSIKCNADVQEKEIFPEVNAVSSSLPRKKSQDIFHCSQKNLDVSHVYGASKEISNSAGESVTGIQNINKSGIGTLKTCLDTLESDTWDSLFDDDGECVHPEVISELTSAVGITQIHFPNHDYSEFRRNNCSTYFDDNKNDTAFGGDTAENSELGNIVELYGFPENFTTQDLVSALSCFRSEHEIRWVDDCHALAIFANEYSAFQAVGLDHPFVKVRPISQGIKASKMKAKYCARTVEPSRPRPATSVALARRLVSGALGLRVSLPKEERERERKIISDAKERKRKAAKQRENIWQGVLE